MKAFGLISGVGSLLYGAKKAGFEIVGNCDWRKYYHTGSFEHNFKRPFTEDIYDYDISKIKGIGGTIAAFIIAVLGWFKIGDFK